MEPVEKVSNIPYHPSTFRRSGGWKPSPRRHTRPPARSVAKRSKVPTSRPNVWNLRPKSYLYTPRKMNIDVPWSLRPSPERKWIIFQPSIFRALDSLMMFEMTCINCCSHGCIRRSGSAWPVFLSYVGSKTCTKIRNPKSNPQNPKPKICTKRIAKSEMQNPKLGHRGPHKKNCYITVQNPKSPKPGQNSLDFGRKFGFWIPNFGFRILDFEGVQGTCH